MSALAKSSSQSQKSEGYIQVCVTFKIILKITTIILTQLEKGCGMKAKIKAEYTDSKFDSGKGCYSTDVTDQVINNSFSGSFSVSTF